MRADILFSFRMSRRAHAYCKGDRECRCANTHIHAIAAAPKYWHNFERD